MITIPVPVVKAGGQHGRSAMDSKTQQAHAHKDPLDRPEVRDYLAGLKRRRAAAHRLVPLTGGYRDPWTGA